MGQELWLTQKQLPQLSYLGVQFTAKSGMEDAVSSGVLRGRPHGGVSIAWSRDLDHVMMPLTDYSHKRVVAAQLSTANKHIIFISIYMPFFDSRKRETCLAETIETISAIERIVVDHPHHLFVIGGDLNCELSGSSPFDELWNDFSTKHRFVFCSSQFSAPGYTYHHASLNQKKFNDHFLISNEISHGSICSNQKIIDDGQNPSDHLPIVMSRLSKCQISSDSSSFKMGKS